MNSLQPSENNEATILKNTKKDTNVFWETAFQYFIITSGNVNRRIY